MTTGPTYILPAQGAGRDVLESEWLLTNGTGAFAMGTAMGCNTRRYHGLLIAAAAPPVERINAVTAMHETLGFDGQSRELANFEFGAGDGTVFHPNGWRHLERFEKDTAARWVYRVGPLEVTRTLRLVWKRQVAVLGYTVRAIEHASDPLPDRVTLGLQPMMALRDFHALRRAYEGEPISVDARGAEATIAAPPLPAVHLRADRGRFFEAHDWWRDFHYRLEAARQLDYRESLFSPGRFEHTFDLHQPMTMQVAMGIEPIKPTDLTAGDPRDEHLRPLLAHVRQQAKVTGPGTTEQKATGQLDADGLAALTIASDDFVVGRTVDGQPMTTIIAGYPWFSDWGRDTMIALPGCLLATGRFDEARQTLLAFARNIDGGLVPNRFDDYGGDPHYNTVDASLWFVHAAIAYLRASDDQRTWNSELADACTAVVEAYRRGTRFDIGMDDNGLVAAGSAQTQLTWMDAARDGVVFTPRWGKAVEINALWHNALAGLANELDGDRADDLRQLARKVQRSFNRTFWDDELGYLVDHVNETGRDTSLRPNQVFAVSLPHGPLAQAKGRKLMQAVRQRLLTPVGLRTLPVDDANYHGRCEGSMFQRDAAYHQGTVWAWLMGPFIEGWLRAHRFSPASRRQAGQFIAPLLEELGRHSLGQLHEIFDGDPPHPPRGCPAQAWSIAELLRTALLIQS